MRKNRTTTFFVTRVTRIKTIQLKKNGYKPLRRNPQYDVIFSSVNDESPTR